MTSPLDPGVLARPAAGSIEAAQRSERAGQREAARQHYELGLRRLGRDDGPAAAAIVRRIARTHVDEGCFDAALDCLEAALAIAETASDESGIAHALNLVAVVYGQRGDVDEVTRIATQALEHARAAGDESLQAFIEQNLGVMASMRGDFTEALEHYAVSLVIFRSAGLHEQLGGVLNNMALVYTQLDRLEEAQAAYDEAVVLYQLAGDAPARLLALVNSADLLVARGDLDRAATLCNTVIGEAQAAEEKRSLGEANKHLGVIARIRGETGEAERRLRCAYDNAMSREDLLLAAETAREQAKLYESMEKSRETLQSLSLSHRLFTRLRAQRDLADLQRRVARLERQFYSIVTRWAQDIESKDAYTRGHCERVADYACLLARDVGFDDITMFWFRIGALLHDVGKIVVPSEILNKPGRLTPEERVQIERHAAAGSELLADIEFPWDILPMVRGHHERWDGTGYPDRLAGEQIALSARITCIADVFDALTTDRPYRPGFTHEQALSMMANDVGTMFDPELFPRFARLMRAGRLTLPGRGWSATRRPSAVAPSTAA
jgi:putative nucleotidyltransferase with HDIG domain